MKHTIDYSDSQAISGFEPLVSDEYDAWVEIRPTISRVEPLDTVGVRIVFQAGDKKTVHVDQMHGDGHNVTTHPNADSAGCYFGGLLAREVGANWGSEQQEKFIGAISQKRELLKQQVSEGNPKIQIIDELKGDLPERIFRRQDPSKDIRLAIVNRQNTKHYYSMIKITASDVEVTLYEGEDHLQLWTSVYRDYHRHNDNALWQLVAAMSIKKETKLAKGDIHYLASRIFSAKEHYNSSYRIPRKEYYWDI